MAIRCEPFESRIEIERQLGSWVAASVALNSAGDFAYPKFSPGYLALYVLTRTAKFFASRLLISRVGWL
jgi:hypothetical protein